MTTTGKTGPRKGKADSTGKEKLACSIVEVGWE